MCIFDVSPVDILFLIYHFMITFPMTIMIVGLFVHQISCVLENCTSVETKAYDSYRYFYKKQNLKFYWIYDQGYRANFRDFFGNSALQWLLPITPTHIQEGDGISWHARPFPVKEPIIDQADVCIDVESSTKRKLTEKL